MARRHVNVSKVIQCNADHAWSITRDFCSPWHPAIASMTAEHNGHVRCFTVHGEDTIYRERLTYMSDSDRTMRYTHIEGIDGAQHYAATLAINPLREGCQVTWEAMLDAEEPRATQIAEGTGAVFEVGIDALAGRVTPKSAEVSVEAESGHIANFIVAGIGVSYAGAPSDGLCIFLHGIGGNRSNWNRQLQCAAKHMRAAAMDLRGYGDSALGGAQTTIEDYCDDILRVMKCFDVKRLVLCGMSFGSWIATSFAMRHPEMLSGLVLSGGCTGMSEAGDVEQQNFLRARLAPLDQGQRPRDFAEAVVNVIVSPEATQAVRQEIFESMAAISPQTYRDALWCFTHPVEKFDFSRVSCPVLLMTGEHDRLAAPAEIRGVARRIHDAARNPDVRFEIIDQAGHLCNIEKPQRFNTVLNQFLSRLSP